MLTFRAVFRSDLRLWRVSFEAVPDSQFEFLKGGKTEERDPTPGVGRVGVAMGVAWSRSADGVGVGETRRARVTHVTRRDARPDGKERERGDETRRGLGDGRLRNHAAPDRDADVEEPLARAREGGPHLHHG